MPKIYIITTTFDSKETCKDFSIQIISQKLAACCQVHQVDSIYPWKGEIANEQEFQLICKTLNKGELVNFIQANHSCDTPEIIIQEVETSEEYFNKFNYKQFEIQTILDSESSSE